ncbi:MAG: leucine-rich repeat protein [Bacteroidales bacterium]|nr:leucine-rich repeat protein [Bacteroidales bacterium]
MKKTILILSLVCLSVIIKAQTKQIEVPGPGQLSSILEANKAPWYFSLTITGEIDARDFKYLRDSVEFGTIDLSNVKIVAYEGTHGTQSNGSYLYPANEIPAYAFFNNRIINHVLLPNTAIAIGYMAFSGCTDLINITNPNTLVSIKNCAFYNSTSLSTINIPSSVTTIGDSAFYRAFTFSYSISASVTIPSSVIVIGKDAFSAYEGTILVDGQNPNYSSQDGVLFNKDKTVLMACPGSLTGDYIIPETVVEISNNAFMNCTRLTSLYIPAAVESIKSSAFINCSASFILEETNKNFIIYDDVLFSKDTTFLIKTPVNKSGEYSIPLTVEEIQDGAFYNCSGLTSIAIPGNVNKIGNSVFAFCTELTTINIPPSINSIGEAAFYQCNNITSIILPSSINSIEKNTFANCNSLSAITIPSTVTSIGDYAFSSCKSLANIEIPSSVISIGKGAFSDCKDLKSINIPELVTSINDNTFEYCIGLNSFSIPSWVTSIGAHAFSECYNLTSINIPESVVYIDPSAFQACYSAAVHVDDKNNYYSSSEGILFNKNKTTLIKYYNSQQDSYTIPSTVTEIANMAFLNCINLKSITIPSTLTTIGAMAFLSCTGLKSMTLPESVTKIGTYAFANCYNLESFTISNSITTIEEGLFWFCSGLASVNLPESLTSIENYAFCGCESLTSLTLPESLHSIGEAAYSMCFNLESVKLSPVTVYIGPLAFFSCNKLCHINIPSTVEFIGYEAFTDCDNLVAVKVNNTVPIDLDFNIENNDIVFEPADNCVLYVPFGTKQKYETADGWKNFSIIVEISDILISETDIIMEASETNASVNVISNINWTADCVDGWLTINPDSGIDFTKITLAASANNDNQDRTATITISAPDMSDQTITVTQKGLEILDIMKESITDYKIYPNPAKEGFTVSNINDMTNLIISDLNGKVVYKSDIKNNHYVNLSELQQGIYIVKLSGFRKTAVHKLVKE